MMSEQFPDFKDKILAELRIVLRVMLLASIVAVAARYGIVIPPGLIQQEAKYEMPKDMEFKLVDEHGQTVKLKAITDK
jgi:hypothetical protein